MECKCIVGEMYVLTHWWLYSELILHWRLMEFMWMGFHMFLDFNQKFKLTFPASPQLKVKFSLTPSPELWAAHFTTSSHLSVLIYLFEYLDRVIVLPVELFYQHEFHHISIPLTGPVSDSPQLEGVDWNVETIGKEWRNFHNFWFPWMDFRGRASLYNKRVVQRQLFICFVEASSPVHCIEVLQLLRPCCDLQLLL